MKSLATHIFLVKDIEREKRRIRRSEGLGAIVGCLLVAGALATTVLLEAIVHDRLSTLRP